MPWRRRPTTSPRGASNSTVSCSLRWSGPSMAIPSRLRTREWAPSAPTRWPARTVREAPVARSRRTTVAPSRSWSKATSSVPKATSASPERSRWRSSTGSRWSWGTAAGVVGLAVVAWSKPGNPRGTAVPSGDASVSTAQPSVASRSSWPGRTSSSRLQERSSSMVRVLTAVARGKGDRPGLRSTSRDPTPPPARAAAVTRPAGPAPATTTGTRSMRSAFGTMTLLLLSLAQPLDGQDPRRVDERAGVGQLLDDGPEPGPPAPGGGVGLAGVLAVTVPERRGPGRGGGQQLAHLDLLLGSGLQPHHGPAR